MNIAACYDEQDAIQDFRNAMARVAAAVHVVTTDGPAGRAGFTATAVCSVTDSPPTLLVCINRKASGHSALLENRVLCVNTLAAKQIAIAQDFGGRLPASDRFVENAHWSVLASGAPVLADALASFDCELSDINSVGSHDVLICKVLAIRNSMEGGGLLYADRRYGVCSGA